MKFYCEDCGSVIDEDDLEKYEESRPGAYGQPCYETFWVCPNCGNVPAEYDYQDKTCEDCVLVGTEHCTYGEPQKKVCGDFIGEDE